MDVNDTSEMGEVIDEGVEFHDELGLCRPSLDFCTRTFELLPACTELIQQ